MEKKETVKFHDSFSEENLDIKEEKISNPAPQTERIESERIEIDTIDISDIKTKPVRR
jgi:hypothetical protein